jgi:hypothetical protein
MDNMLDPNALYGDPDAEFENPYARFQAFSGAKLAAGGPTTQIDQSAYGNNDPRFYTDQTQNLNNAGPPTMYQPIQAGNGAGVSAYPSTFSAGVYVRIVNRGMRTIRVAAGVFDRNGIPAFYEAASIDDSKPVHYPEAQTGGKAPMLIELPSKALYYRTVTFPTAPNQIMFYAPFESELQERRLPCAEFGHIKIYADSPNELRQISAYMQRISSPAPSPYPPQDQPPYPQQSPQYIHHQAAAQQQSLYQQPPPLMTGNIAQGNQHPYPRNAAQTVEVTPVRVMNTTAPEPEPEPTAPRGPSMLTSALFLIGGVLATHYIQNLNKPKDKTEDLEDSEDFEEDDE